MTKKYGAEWTIVPDRTPKVIRHCSKCNRKMPFYCSEKFRVNGNHAKLDIWLIYKCEKCDTTWKLTIDKGVRPQDIPADTFDGFVNNDNTLAWKYAFDRALLKRQNGDVSYESIHYKVEGFDASQILFDPALTTEVFVKSPYPFDLKLSAFIAECLNTSISSVKKLSESGLITVEPVCSVMKYKIRNDLIIKLPFS